MVRAAGEPGVLFAAIRAGAHWALRAQIIGLILSAKARRAKSEALREGGLVRRSPKGEDGWCRCGRNETIFRGGQDARIGRPNAVSDERELRL